ncbi:MAG: flagellar M-ring protein FliF, partial [Sandarakinorhabdus sp.]|nr:flagellar M-ring protein FliF [Sandarakinorhabdus sp.]
MAEVGAGTIVPVAIGGAPAATPVSLPDRARGLLASPAVAQARPAILVVLVLLVIAGLWMGMRSPEWRPLYGDLSDGDKAAVMTALQAGNYTARINPDTGGVEVGSGDVAAARILLAGQGLPKSARVLDPVGDMPLGLSRAVESARLKSAAAVELAASIEAIDGVKHATVHIATPEPPVFVRDKAPASASVFVTLAPGRTLGEAQVRAIVWLVSSSVAGLAADKVSVVDQSGALLSAGSTEGEAAQLGYQVKVEAMVRERLFKLLTPLIGMGKFTAEVAADVDFTQSEASSERYAPDGAVLRSEAASRAIDSQAGPASGVPGA